MRAAATRADMGKGNAVAFKLSRKLRGQVDALVNDLTEAAEDFRNEWSEKSDRWQEGDRAAAADAWIDEIESVVSELENLGDVPEY